MVGITIPFEKSNFISRNFVTAAIVFYFSLLFFTTRMFQMSVLLLVTIIRTDKKCFRDQIALNTCVLKYRNTNTSCNDHHQKCYVEKQFHMTKISENDLMKRQLFTCPYIYYLIPIHFVPLIPIITK